MHNLELARIIHLERVRELELQQRVRAFRLAQEAGARDAFVPPPVGAPERIVHAVRLAPTVGKGG